jgi:hypothetical protein
MRFCAWTLTGALLLGAAWGCDDKGNGSLPPEVKAREDAASKLPPRENLPTTQELLTGEKKTLKLGEFPLSLQVPRTWQLKSWGDVSTVIMVTGPASSGEISIQLVQLGQPFPADRLPAVVQDAKKEAAAKPHPINRVELRSVGPIKVLEQRMISNKYDENGKLPPERWDTVEIEGPRTSLTTEPPKVTTRAIVNPHVVKWTLTAFIPTGADKDKLVPRTLQFMGLKLSEYEQDKEFLEQLVKSLKYEE